MDGEGKDRVGKGRAGKRGGRTGRRFIAAPRIPA
jgi:hypothetical protein